MTEQSPNYLPEDPRPAALRLAEFVKGWASAWPEFSGAHKSGMETAAELLRLHAENQALATDFNVARDAYDAARLEIESLQAMLDAVGAGGVERLRRAKCLHQIVEPQPAAKFGGWIFLRDDVRDIIDVTEPNGTRHTLTKSIWAEHKQLARLFEAMRRGLMQQPAPQPPAVAALSPLEQLPDGHLYGAINNLLCHCAMEGSIDADHGFVHETMAALKKIDGGVYLPDLAVTPAGQRLSADEAMHIVMAVEKRHSFLRGTTSWAVAVVGAVEDVHGITDTKLGKPCRCGKETVAWCFSNSCHKAGLGTPQQRLTTEAAPFCPNCRFALEIPSHWTECVHRQHGRERDQNILWGCGANPLDMAPDWCPLRKEGGAA